jgi:hypothetical protein
MKLAFCPAFMAAVITLLSRKFISFMETRLIQFLREELGLSEAAIALVTQRSELPANLLPMRLWQYGLVTLDELNRIFDWLAAA